MFFDWMNATYSGLSLYIICILSVLNFGGDAIFTWSLRSGALTAFMFMNPEDARRINFLRKPLSISVTSFDLMKVKYSSPSAGRRGAYQLYMS